MRDPSGRGSRHQRGLDAALKRLWPDGGGPTTPATQAPPCSATPGDSADAPTLPYLEPDRALHLRAPRNTCALAAASATLIAAWLLTAVGAPRAREDADPGWSIPPLENLTVRGAIRIVDDLGNVVAVFGNVPGEAGKAETLALELRSQNSDGPKETLRLESLASGATLSLRTPDRHSSMTLVSGEAGPYLLMAQGSQQRLIGTENADALPEVGAGGPEGRELDLLDRRAQALEDGLSAVDLRISRGRLRGRILNTSSVRHTGIEVDLALADQHLALQIPLVSPGNSTGFAVPLPPGVPEAMLRSARVARVTSTLHYDAHQPGSESAQTR